MPTKGIAMFAYDSGELVYGDMSLANALLIKKHLRMNDTALITSGATIDALVAKHGRALVDAAFDEIVISEVDTNSAALRRFRDTRYSTFETRYLNGNKIGRAHV